MGEEKETVVLYAPEEWDLDLFLGWKHLQEDPV